MDHPIYSLSTNLPNNYNRIRLINYNWARFLVVSQNANENIGKQKKERRQVLSKKQKNVVLLHQNNPIHRTWLGFNYRFHLCLPTVKPNQNPFVTFIHQKWRFDVREINGTGTPQAKNKHVNNARRIIDRKSPYD